MRQTRKPSVVVGLCGLVLLLLSFAGLGLAQSEGNDETAGSDTDEARPAETTEQTTASAAETAEQATASAAETAEQTTEGELSVEERRFLGDVRALVRRPHRLAGTEAGALAADHIEERLAEIGIEERYALEMPLWQQRTERCEVEVAGQTQPAFPMRPNVVVPPVTPADGLSGPLIYVGRGDFADYGDRDVSGAIVVLDYDSADHWERAFAVGAKAVVFLGQPEATPLHAKHVGVPSNQVRLYVEDGAGLDLRKDHPEAAVSCRVHWEKRTGKNLIARVKGTAPVISEDRKRPEMIVLGAHYDSFGAIPELAAGARSAANVAALLEAAERVLAAPPKRDVLFVFFDAELRGHQGSRELYSALLLPEEASNKWHEDQSRELEHKRAMLELLRAEGLGFDLQSQLTAAGIDVALWLENELRSQADHARDDVRKRLRVARLAAGEEPTAAERNAVSELDAESLRWDDVRRALHQSELRAFVDEKTSPGQAHGDAYLRIFVELQQRTRAAFERRIRELEAGVEVGKQRATLREGLGFDSGDEGSFIALHVGYDFSDAGATWGVVVGDWSQQLFAFRPPKAEGDTPGYYGRILNALSEVEVDAPSLDPDTLKDPSLGPTFAPGPFVSNGAVAGAYGIYNVSLMTGHDRRPRDGHPADTLERLDWQKLRGFAVEGTSLLLAAASAEGLSLPRVFKDQAINKLPGWNDGQSTGDYAGLTVSGSLAEKRPASGALMALWPGQKGWLRQAWMSLRDADVIASFDPLALERVDENGRFRIASFREDMHTEVMSLGAVFDENGEVAAISTTEHQAQKLTDAMRVNLFFGNGGKWTALHSYDAQPGLVKLLKASSDSYFRDNRALWGQLGGNGFFYISDQLVDYDLKLFQPMGEAVLGEFGDDFPFGSGVAPGVFRRGTSLSQRSAEDLWALNESRLRKLRTRGVTSADLEILHGRARRAREQSSAERDVELREAGLMRSAALSQRVYLPLRQKMDDLVHAIVMLLLLSIPFAFALERLLICATTVYGRIGGFSATFLATFGLLYWMHPGFAIAATPMIIFLAFAIVLLSSLVIYIVVRKFKTELRAVQQGQGASAHQLEVSRTGTLLAAVGMGMSTMRRRPTRTFLTAVTVVMLTFTILSFASFSQTVGVRSIYEGPVSEQTAPRILVRKLDYSQLPDGLLDMLSGSEGEGGLLAPQYWLVRKQASSPRLSVARSDTGKALTIDAVMGLSLPELDRWPQLASALGSGSLQAKQAALERGGVYLPAIVQEVLELSPGDAVLLNGESVEFAGTLDGPLLQRIKHLDNQALLPVDFQDAASLTAADASNTQADENDLLLAEEVDREFVHLSSDQVVVASAELVKRLGGRLHLVSVHPGTGFDVVERGKRLAELVVMPVWAAGEEGVERMLLTILTGVSGGLALFVPLLLGGLIIFGTLLGSISDREKEIYTFSALGLSPGHVGVLFFAEAAVYAVVGGMGGQLLAQCVGLAASHLAEVGLIKPTNINYSSTNSLFAIAVVMATVLVSAIYPAVRASKSANPGLARTWKMPPAEGDVLKLTFPFTVSAYDITGVVSFLADHFRRHDDAGLGNFAASDVEVGASENGNLELRSELALAPFDLGVTQHLVLTAVPSEIEGVDEVSIRVTRLSGARADWYRANKVFMRDLRQQFLLWRTLSAEVIEDYRRRTLELLGPEGDERDTPEPEDPAEPEESAEPEAAEDVERTAEPEAAAERANAPKPPGADGQTEESSDSDPPDEPERKD